MPVTCTQVHAPAPLVEYIFLQGHAYYIDNHSTSLLHTTLVSMPDNIILLNTGTMHKTRILDSRTSTRYLTPFTRS